MQLSLIQAIVAESGSGTVARMEAVAEFDFTATEPKDELSFTKGQVVKVLSSDEDVFWYRAEIDGHEGFIPKNYVKLVEERWFVGRLSSQEVSSILSTMPAGTFVIRHSHTQPGDYALSVKEDSVKVQHYRIKRDRGMYRVWELSFRSLNDLVAYYKSYSISRQKCCCLRDDRTRELPTASHSDLLYVQAVFDFSGSEDGDMSFRKDDVIRVKRQDESGWWEGILDGKVGVFPATYVVPYIPEIRK